MEMYKNEDKYLGDGVMPVAGCDCIYFPAGYTYLGVDNVERILDGYEPIFDRKTPKPKKVFNEHVKVIKKGVLEVKVDAIVNATNKTLCGQGGVSGAVFKEAGPQLLEECKTLKGCKTGDAKITKAYNLKNSSYIIHTVGPVYRGKQKDAGLLASCYYNSMDLALKNNCKSIAFPGISTGGHKYPIKEAAKIAIYSVLVWFSKHKHEEIKVLFCCFSEEEEIEYNKIITEQKLNK